MSILEGQWTFGSERRAPSLARSAEPPSAKSHHALYETHGIRFEARGLPSAMFDDSGARQTDSAGSFCVAWHGRLDNREDLARELGRSAADEDIDFVAAAFAKWRIGAFPKLRGDWSVSIWDARNRSLILAKDPMGTRPLFYAVTERSIRWSTSLEALVTSSEAKLDLNLEYLAGWLTFFPAAHVTPYTAIAAVPPSCTVHVQERRVTIRKYWEFTPSSDLTYRDDFAYEEHFRFAFTTSVRRRLRSDHPLLAELSGGVDSSSIVCVADALLKHEHGLTPRLDTFSYYDDEEPNWNERPYFALVEARRGRPSLHVRADSGQDLLALFGSPSELCSVPSELLRHAGYRAAFRNHFLSGNYAGVLSGIGGDEFTGGVPTPIPELADLLASARLRSLVHRLKDWSLSQRRPWMHVLFDAIRGFAPSWLAGTVPARRPPVWLDARFRRRYRFALTGYEKPMRPWGSRPSFQENLAAVESLRRQLAASNVGAEGVPEKRYPFLDVDFLQFLFSVPRSQLVQPGRRRALMRSALAGIVPDEILNRKRKAYVTRAPRRALAAHWKPLQSLTHEMVSESLNVLSSELFRNALEEIRAGKEVPILPVHRTLLIECWLRNLVQHQVVSPATRQEPAFSRRSVASAI